ncbi:hypothetical protein [Escherichia coli]|uniref:hypothetical protein n=1 Tax=Escherichia coli TaxID=562 RepID=UPI0020233ECB|nr:hypothetical protein [Escherichia coli]
MADIDLSGQSPEQGTTPKGDLDPDILIRRDIRDGIERRSMRLVLSAVVLCFACTFLWQGLNFALAVGNGLLEAKSSIATAITQKVDAQTCVSAEKCSALSADPKMADERITPSSDTNKVRKSISGLSTDWLSASSLIAIVAFILGVGLTLLLTLLKSVFQHPTDKDFRTKSTSNTIELATPISELIIGVLNIIKDKLSK